MSVYSSSGGTRRARRFAVCGHRERGRPKQQDRRKPSGDLHRRGLSIPFFVACAMRACIPASLTFNCQETRFRIVSLRSGLITFTRQQAALNPSHAGPVSISARSEIHDHRPERDPVGCVDRPSGNGPVSGSVLVQPMPRTRFWAIDSFTTALCYPMAETSSTA